MQTQTNPMTVVTNGVKLVGETVVPGASLLLDGQFVNGAAHVAAGLGARLAFGPIGLLLVCADSFSKSVTDKFLWDHVKDTIDARKAAKAAKAAEAAEAQSA